MLNWEDPIANFGRSSFSDSYDRPTKPDSDSSTETPLVDVPATFDNLDDLTNLHEPNTLNKHPQDLAFRELQRGPQSVSATIRNKISTADSTPASIHAPDQEAATVAPVSVADKRVINGLTDINQLAPFKYPWAWEFFLNANKNHWTPLDINMSKDIQDYHHRLTVEEKHLYENVLAYLTTSDIMAMRNIGLAVMEKMTAPELQIYQARQVYEEALHIWTYQHCIETLGIDQSEIYNRYRVVGAINRKIQLANDRLNSVLRSDIDLNDKDELENFVMSYIFFAAIFEGCWFYNGFSPIFALQRRGLMTGTAEQLQYIMRDEVLHCAFGIRTVKTIIQENNVTLNPTALRQMWDETEAAEIDYANYILRDPIVGYNAQDHIAQFRYIANRRAKSVGIEQPFPGAKNTLTWLDEQANLRKEKNFFETRVTEYQTGGALNWD